MGISGLLPLLKSITQRVHIETLAGQAVAVDAYSWLHRGVYLCASDIFFSRPNHAYVEYCMARIRLLTHFGVKPILVFDGDMLPIKSGLEESRKRSRLNSRMRAEAKIAADDPKGAALFIHKAVDVTPDMAFCLIQELKRAEIDFVVAPYEADAQMAYLANTGQVAAVVTEDSDLLLFGCKRILFKLDSSGYADEIRTEHLGRVSQVDLTSFDLDKFRQMCILSGCDYLASVNGMGLKTAHRYFLRYKRIERVLTAVRADFAHKMPPDYEERFRMAELTFLHQVVFDQRSRRLVNLVPIDPLFKVHSKIPSWDFLGPLICDDVALRIARGLVNPISKLPFLPELLTPLSQPSQPSQPSQDSQNTSQPLAAKRITLKRSLSMFDNPNHQRKFMFSSRSLQSDLLSSIPTFFFDQKRVAPGLKSGRRDHCR